MQTNSDQPAMTAEANDSRTASDEAVVCKELLGERFDVICHTKRCGWAGDWEDTSASRVESGNVVECDPNLPDAELCCPKCLLTNLVETDGWVDDQLAR